MIARSVSRYVFPVLLVLGFAGSVWAGDLVVTITGVNGSNGEVGCTLFSTKDGFPMKSEKGKSQWQAANGDSLTFRFTGLSTGTYAVASSHDLNGNRKTDRTFVGLPKEDWGVSNNVRPTLRAPRFKEAAFEIKEGETVEVTIELGR